MQGSLNIGSIVNWLAQDGVVLGADTRSTAGSTVADKNCEKIHFIAPNIYCCGAGTAADTENVTGQLAVQGPGFICPALPCHPCFMCHLGLTTKVCEPPIKLC